MKVLHGAAIAALVKPPKPIAARFDYPPDQPVLRPLRLHRNSSVIVQHSVTTDGCRGDCLNFVRGLAL
jgi:hypothetical protein